MRHRTVEEGHTVEKMDTVDSLTRKLISSFEHLGDYLLLEQLAVPEDLWDLEGSVELWVASTHAYGAKEDIVSSRPHKRANLCSSGAQCPRARPAVQRRAVGLGALPARYHRRRRGRHGCR